MTFTNPSQGLGPRLQAAASAVVPALQAAAARTGVDFEALFRTARVESGFNPAARAGTSSASGLFQFVDSTWLQTLARHGATHGISAGSRSEALALRDDPYVASLMAAEHMADNKALLERGLGRPVATADLYLAHFLGAGGAMKFLGALDSDPGAPGAALLPAAARANPGIFYDNGAPRSLADIRALLARRLGTDDGGPDTAGTSVPAVAASGGTYAPDAAGMPFSEGLPPAVAAQIVALVGGAPAASAEATADPRLAAQAAYLMLAELGA
jgi:hypothetical protein